MEETEYPIHTDISTPEQGVSDAVAERSGCVRLLPCHFLQCPSSPFSKHTGTKGGEGVRAGPFQ